VGRTTRDIVKGVVKMEITVSRSKLEQLLSKSENDEIKIVIRNHRLHTKNGSIKGFHSNSIGCKIDLPTGNVYARVDRIHRKKDGQLYGVYYIGCHAVFVVQTDGEDQWILNLEPYKRVGIKETKVNRMIHKYVEEYRTKGSR
jgi:hypothetical protein